jgi:hypothetical protein
VPVGEDQPGGHQEAGGEAAAGAVGGLEEDPADRRGGPLAQGKVPERHQVGLLDDAFQEAPVGGGEEVPPAVQLHGLGLLGGLGLKAFGLSEAGGGVELGVAVDGAHGDSAGWVGWDKVSGLAGSASGDC